jgi:hypothetical protein
MSSSVTSKRAPNWSSTEIDTLQEAVNERKCIFEASANTVEANLRKNRAWQQIADTVNSVGGHARTAENCRKRWSDFKSSLKQKLATIRKEQTRTGGGISMSPSLTATEEKAAESIRRQAVEGVPLGIDTLQQPAAATQSRTPATIAAAASRGTERDESVAAKRASASPDYETADDDDEIQQPAAASTPPPRSKRNRLELIANLEKSRLRTEEERLKVEKERLETEKERLQVERELLRVRQQSLEVARERLAVKKNQTRSSEGDRQLHFFNA